MKKNKIKKINKVVSASLASSVLIGTMAQNVTIVSAAEITSESLNSNIDQKSAVTLPEGFNSNVIGNSSNTGSAIFNEESKSITMNGTGTYIGKDIGVTDNYHFVSYKVEGNATIVARLVDFDMTNAKYGQCGVFMRDDNTDTNSDYFGVYVEPSKSQYRYAYRGNSNSGAAAINGLTEQSKNKFIKIVKINNNIRYYISDDLNFDKEGVLSNSQTINNSDKTWYVGFVTSNGSLNGGEATATFDNITIEDETGILYTSNPIEDDNNGSNGGSDDEITGVTSSLEMTKEPNSTVFDKNIEICGKATEDGSLKILLDGKLVQKETTLNENETFSNEIALKRGRNTIEVVYTSKENVVTTKKYNVLSIEENSYDIIVDSEFKGTSGTEENGVTTFKTVTEAVSSISTKNDTRKVIYIKNGTYKEKLTIQSPYISLVGEDKDKTIVTFDDAAGTKDPNTGLNIGTGKSASVTIKANAFGFTAENLTFENSFVEKGNKDEQAVALSNEADQSSLINCRFVGNQDTLLANASSSKPARQYYSKCTIEGDVDFIFGRAQAVFDDCDIISLDRKSSSNNGYITAANTWSKDAYGYLIINSRLLGTDGILDNTVSLGRPWRPSGSTLQETPAVTYINCYMGSHISTKGWQDMSTTSLAKDSRFSEYGSYGPGAKESDTRLVLSEAEKDKYTLENVFAKNSATINGEDAYSVNWNPYNDDENNNNVSINKLYKITENDEDLDNDNKDDDIVDDDNKDDNIVDDNNKDDNLTDGDDEENNELKTWMKNSDGTWSLIQNNVRLTGWQEVDEKWYYMDQNGIMKTDWISVNGKWYYLNSQGEMVTGWLENSGSWYYLKEDGSMAIGWISVNNKWYYFNSNGKMLTGWLKDGSSWYYLKNDGSMATGWISINNKWYYLYSNGKMATGWLKDGSAWYYLNSNGSMATGWISVNNKWYYFNSNGKMATGWLKDGSTWYYLYNNGSMAYNTVIDGYRLSANGSMVK